MTNFLYSVILGYKELVMSEIKFHEVVKMIHPDIHPEVKDASVKMSLAVKYKNDALALWNLCVKWKLVKGEYNISAPEAEVPVIRTTTPVRPTTPTPYDDWMRGFTRAPVLHKCWEELKPFDRVRYTLRSGTFEGIIMGISNSTFVILTGNTVVRLNKHDRFESYNFVRGDKPSKLELLRALKTFKRLNVRKKFWSV